MDTPAGIAKFDSSSALAIALARFLDGRDFTGLGQPRLLQFITRRAGWVPRRLRERAFAHLGAQEGIDPGDIESVSMQEVARWAADLYPRRRYPAVTIGSSNGALMHVNAALGAPWLPQTFLTLVHQKQVDPDDPARALEAASQAARRFVAANPESQLHHMHDPSQDRLMLDRIAYFRSKYLRLPEAYREFLRSALAPGGTLYIVECERRWPTTQVDERYLFQFGAEGGPTEDEYFHGGERVADYLRRYDSPVTRWQPPEPDTCRPEAEWGFEPALREDIVREARALGLRAVRLIFEDPEDPSALVAEFYRTEYRKRGLPADRLLIESFVVHEPYWTLRTGSVPYWMSFNMQPSQERLEAWLGTVEGFAEIYLTLFAHGVDSVGLPPVETWRRLLDRARVRGDYLGLDTDAYPAHFAHFGRYAQALRDEVKARYPLPPPTPPEVFERFVAEHGVRHGVRLEAV